MSDSIRESVNTLVADFKAATADHVITGDEMLTIGRDVVDVLAHSKDPDAKEVAVETVESLFDNYIIPHNFPRVPDILERWGKSTARAQIRPLVESGYDFVVGVAHAA